MWIHLWDDAKADIFDIGIWNCVKQWNGKYTTVTKKFFWYHQKVKAMMKDHKSTNIYHVSKNDEDHACQIILHIGKYVLKRLCLHISAMKCIQSYEKLCTYVVASSICHEIDSEVHDAFKHMINITTREYEAISTIKPILPSRALELTVCNTCV